MVSLGEKGTCSALRRLLVALIVAVVAAVLEIVELVASVDSVVGEVDQWRSHEQEGLIVGGRGSTLVK